MISPRLPFAAHALVETPAALSFILTPEKQLPGCTPAAKLILRQYGGLLLSSVLVCIFVLLEPGSFDGVACRLLAAALGSYHVWPCYRAYVRLRSGAGREDAAAASTLGGPAIHLAVHSVCFAMFVFVVASEIDGQ
ncbi:hypothetical protein DL767_006772 [Monosporascus sp. MG133]|nr:hypothetical protein DL767_006772 [Monosporascus sp. MG133]